MIAERLRKSVLQYAIEGKLTEQLDSDGDARDLLKFIEEEKEKLINEKKIRREKPLPEITEEEIPFDIPDNWEWLRLGNIGTSTIGLTYSPKDVSNEGVIVLRAGNVQDGKLCLNDLIKVNKNIPESKICDINDLLICSRSGSKHLVGKTALIDKEGYSFGAFMTIFRTKLYNYVYHYLSTTLFRGDLDKVGTTTINQITKDNLNNRIIPIPPLPEQKRIVEKLEEILPEINKLEKLEIELKELEDKFPKSMKNSILQAAMTGKLTEQLDTDDRVEELLKSIELEKEKLIKEKKIRREKPLPEITEEEMPFDIPDNWEWVRLSEVSFNVGGVQNKILQRDILEKGEIPVISQSQSLIEGYSNDKDKILENPGELIVFGDHSKTLKYIDFDFIIGADGTRILCPFEISGRYLYYSIQLLIVDLITQNYGRHYKFIKDAFISLPPLAEQKRIVEKLDKILLILEGIE